MYRVVPPVFVPTEKLSQYDELYVAVGISSASREGALAAVVQEVGESALLPRSLSLDLFTRKRQHATAVWEEALGRIRVATSSASESSLRQKRIFYTALYHAQLHPSLFTDALGAYKGADGVVRRINSPAGAGEEGPSTVKETLQREQERRGPVKETHQHEHYSTFSLWDTFRAQHPLHTLIQPLQLHRDFVNSFVRTFEQAGKLPVWLLAGAETNTMVGLHSIAVLTDLIVKRYVGPPSNHTVPRDDDGRAVSREDEGLKQLLGLYKAMRDSMLYAEPGGGGGGGGEGGGGGGGATGLDLDLVRYRRRGWLGRGETSGSVTKSLEWGFNEWCLARAARAIREIVEESLQKVLSHSLEKGEASEESRERAEWAVLEAEVGVGEFFEDLCASVSVSGGGL